MDNRRIHRTVNEVIIKGKRSGKLAIFDLDDTLIISQAKIQVLDPHTGKVIKSLTPEQFNHYTHDPKNALSFSEFEDADILRKSSFITEILEKLLNFYRSGVHVSIVTARSNTKLIRDFFLENGIDIHPDLVIAVNDPMYKFTGNIAERKKQAIHGLIEHGYRDLVFFDDNEDNLRLAKEIEKERDVNVETVKVG
jgi:hypothetical protein